VTLSKGKNRRRVGLQNSHLGLQQFAPTMYRSNILWIHERDWRSIDEPLPRDIRPETFQIPATSWSSEVNA